MLGIVGESGVLKEETGAVRRSLTFLFLAHPDSSNLLWYGLAVCLGVGGWLTTAAVPSGLRSPATPTITLPAPYKVYPQDNWSRLDERADNNCWKIVAKLPGISLSSPKNYDLPFRLLCDFGRVWSSFEEGEGPVWIKVHTVLPFVGSDLDRHY